MNFKTKHFVNHLSIKINLNRHNLNYKVVDIIDI
jgi:hypothetical protein